MKKYLSIIIVFSLFIITLPIAQSHSIQTTNSDSWGIILKKNMGFQPMELFDNVSLDNITWFSTVLMQTSVSGIGKHYIRTELDYSVQILIEENGTSYLKTLNGTMYNNDTLYLFNIHQKPIIKQKSDLITGDTAFYLYMTGTFIGRLYIDDQLVLTGTYTYIHH